MTSGYIRYANMGNIMREIALRWMNENMKQTDYFTRVCFYIRDERVFKVYFEIITNRELNIRSKWISSNTLVTNATISQDDLLSFLPESMLEDRRRFDLSREYNQSDGSTFTLNRDTDIRMERRSPTNSPSWGTDKSVLQFEHWTEESDIPTGTDAAREALHNEILKTVGSNLKEYPDHIGNCIIQLEDERAEAYFENGWCVEIDNSLIDPSDVEIIAETREHGELLWRSVATPVGSGPDDGYEQPGEILIDYQSGSETLNYENLKPPGANEQAIRVLCNGDTVTEQSMPLIRTVIANLTIRSPGQTQQGNSAEPPDLYPEHDLSGQPTGVIGEHVWDYRRLDFGTGASRGWTTDSDAGVVDRALSTVKNDLRDVVKIVDPYLEAGLFVDFIKSLNPEISVWAITSVLKNKTDFESELPSFAGDGREVEVLRVMDNNGGRSKTPIHDRFIITKDRKSWILGTSFETLDKNVSVISELPHRVTTALDRQFNQWWTEPVRMKDDSGDCNKSHVGTSAI